MPSDTAPFAQHTSPIPSQAEGADVPRFTTPPEFRALGSPWTVAEDVAKVTALATTVPTELVGWIDRLRRAGIAADRRTSPDIFGQLGQALRRPIDTVLCSVLDVDPAACLNSALAARFPLELAAAVTIIGRITNADRVSIITDARVPSSWFTSLRRAVAGMGIRLEAIVNDYPQADPTLMLYTLLGRRLRPGRLPTDQGVVLFDAAAAVSMGRYALLNEPMLQAPIVIRDHVENRSLHLTLPVGMTLAEASERLGLTCRGRVLRAGDLLRDMQVQPDTVIGGGELIFHIALPSPPLNPGPCIRCGWCVDACPTRVQPASVLEAAQADDLDIAEAAGIEACIDCGVCSYICPSQLPLLEGIRRMKGRLKE